MSRGIVLRFFVIVMVSMASPINYCRGGEVLFTAVWMGIGIYHQLSYVVNIAYIGTIELKVKEY